MVLCQETLPPVYSRNLLWVAGVSSLRQEVEHWSCKYIVELYIRLVHVSNAKIWEYSQVLQISANAVRVQSII